MLVSNGLSENQADTLIHFGNQVDGLRELQAEFGNFKAYVDDDNNFVIEALSGWKVIYPPMTSPWVYLTTWMSDWENCGEIMEAFVKMLVFPVCNRIDGIDADYIKDIWDAHLRLDGRLSVEEDVEESNEKDDLDESEKISEGFAKVMEELSKE